MSAPTANEPANAAAFAGRVAHMRTVASSGRRPKGSTAGDMALARKVIAMSRMGEAALRFSRDEADRPGADLEALYKSVADARDALAAFISNIARHPRLCMLKPLFEDALGDWDSLAENLALVATPERRALLDDLEQAVRTNKDKFANWRDADLFQ